MMQSPSKLQPLHPSANNHIDGPPPSSISASSPSRANTQRTSRAAARAARAAARASQSDNLNSNNKANTLGYEASFLASESTRFFGKTPSQNRILTADLLFGNDGHDDGLDGVMERERGNGGGKTGKGGKDRDTLNDSHKSGPMTFDGRHAKLPEDNYNKNGARHSFDAGTRHPAHRRGSNPPPRNYRSKRHSMENIAVPNSMGKSNGNGPNNFNRRRNSKGLDGSDRSGGLSQGSFRADRTNVGSAGRQSDYCGGRKSNPLLDVSDKSLNYNRLFEASERSNMNMHRKHMEISEKSNEFTARRKSSGHISALSNNSGNNGLERRRHSTLLEAGQDTAQSSGRRPRQGNNNPTRLSNGGSSDNVKRRGSNRVGPYHSQKSRDSNKSSDEEGGLLTIRDMDAPFDRIQDDGRGKRGSISMNNSGDAGKGRPHFAPPIVSDQSSIDWGDEGEGSPKNTATGNDRLRGAIIRPNGGSGTLANINKSGNTTSKTFVIRTKTQDGEEKERFLDVANMDDAPKLRTYNERGDLVEEAAAGIADTDSVLAVTGPTDRVKFDKEAIKNQSLNIQTFRTRSYYMGQKSQRPQDALPLVDESDRSSLQKLDSMKNVLDEERNRHKRSIIDKDFTMGVHKKRGFWGLCFSGNYGRRSGDSVRNVSKKRRKRKCMILIAMLLATLGGVAVALYFLIFRKDANEGVINRLENMNGSVDSSTHHSEHTHINSTNEMTNSTSNITLLPPGNSSDFFSNDTTSTTQWNDTVSNSTNTPTTQKNVTNSNITNASNSSEINQGPLIPANENAINATRGNETAYPTFSFTYMPTPIPTLFPRNSTGSVPSIASGFDTPTFSPVPSFIGANATNPSYGSNDTIVFNSTSEDPFITNNTFPSNSSESVELPENSFPSNTTVGNLTDANSTTNWDDSFINETITYGLGENSTLNMTEPNSTVSAPNADAFPKNDSNVTEIGSENPEESETLPTTNLETIPNATDSEAIENLDTNSYKRSFSIIGPSPSSRFGTSVAISADGSIIAVGANEALSEAGEAAGAVFLYSLEIVDGLQTYQLLQVINGTVPNGEFGNSVGVSNDGIRIIIGSRSESDQTGAARIYNRANSTGLWELMGESITGQYEIGRTGWSVSISGDGNVVAIGSPRGGTSQGGTIATYKFEEQSFSWQPYNGEIKGVVEEFIGFSVSLTHDGSLIATGSPKATTALGSANAGKVGIYKQGESSNWTPLMDEIFGQNADDNDGSSVAVSQDGSILVSGAKGWDGDAILDSGYCRIHELQNNQFKLVYTILGQQANEQMGSAVAVSAEGSVIACGGSNGSKDNSTDSGVVRVWNRDTGEEGTIWPPEADIDFQGSLFGASLTFSADGQVLVVGAPGAMNRTGVVQVYYRS